MADQGQSNIAAMTPVAPVLAADGTATDAAAAAARGRTAAARATAATGTAGKADGTASAARVTTVLNAAVTARGLNTGRPSGHGGDQLDAGASATWRRLAAPRLVSAAWAGGPAAE